jgi:hypothetical protein
MIVEEVELTYDPKTGVTKVHVKGVKGKDCRALTKELEEDLGGHAETHTTAEYNESGIKAGVKVGR